MDSHKLAVKFFAEASPELAHDAFIPVFHSWIQQHALKDHLLIDVADYAHVPDGPGTVLVSHEANISTDREHGKLGLLYVRKQPIDGATTFPRRLAGVFRAALEAAAKLEEEANLRGKLKFRGDELSFRIYDRLLAPNTPATFEQVKPQLQRFFSELYSGVPVTLTQSGQPDELFDIKVKAQATPTIATLRQRLG
jgi:hypothetical protein